MSAKEVTVPVAGGSWLIGDVPPAEVFTPEDLNEEQRLVGQTVQDFVER